MEKQLKETFNYSAEDVRYINVKESSTLTRSISAAVADRRQAESKDKLA